VLLWIKKSGPEEWARMLSLEKRVNQDTLRGDVESLKQGLSRYKKLLLRMMEVFETPKTQGNLF
jgi:hypothetical protein